MLAALASSVPVSSPQDAKIWFESKGWILSGENYTKSKLVDILFTVAINSKIPIEAKLIILAIAFLLEAIAKDDLATSLLDKILEKLDGAISNFKVDVDSTKKFLTATSSQQAECTLAFQTAVEAFSGNVDKLTQALVKATESIGTHQKKLSDVDWPILSNTNPLSEAPSNSLIPRLSSLTLLQVKIQQCMALATKQIYVTTDPNDNKAPSSHTIKDQHKLRDNLT